jgi:hypothetical protein
MIFCSGWPRSAGLARSKRWCTTPYHKAVVQPSCTSTPLIQSVLLTQQMHTYRPSTDNFSFTHPLVLVYPNLLRHLVLTSAFLQIKNIVATAHALATKMGSTIHFDPLRRAIVINEKFAREFILKSALRVCMASYLSGWLVISRAFIYVATYSVVRKAKRIAVLRTSFS